MKTEEECRPTLRDQFAMAALMVYRTDIFTAPEYIAEKVYKIADVMMRTRNTGERICDNCRWCNKKHYEEVGEDPYIKMKCANKYGLTKDYTIYAGDFCSRWEGADK